ncbi:MAG TPA: glycosyltransferase family 2 protein [Pseudomonadales bacterium]
MREKPKVLLIIPCFNEAGSIAALLQEIKTGCPEYETVVIDDGSRDNTYAIAKTLSPTVRLLKNLGIGGAVQTGIKYAAQHDFDFCAQIDGDGQHPPEEVKKLLAAWQEKPRSILIGSRYIAHDTFRSTWTRRLGSQIISTALNRLFGQCRVSDPTSGMRLMDREAIALFAAHYPHDFPEPISLAWALRSGLSAGEVPVKMRAREHGQSSIIGWKPIAYMFRVLSYIILARLSRSSLQ